MTPGSASSLVLDAAFDAEDPRFVEFLREVEEPSRLAALVDRWKRDPRPWARARQLEYLDLPFDRRGHEVVVKRLFKQAEERRDDELVAACAVAFDRLIRRRVGRRSRWDPATRQRSSDEVLVGTRDRLPWIPGRRHVRDPKSGLWLLRDARTAEWLLPPAGKIPKDARLFTHRTRRHLRRRAWRYFRRIGFRRPDTYVPTVARALRLYHDADVTPGVRLLDCWTLLHACFGRHDALEFTPRVARLRPGRGLSELGAAPRFPALWTAPEAAAVLLDLVATARSRLVRRWAMELVRRDHAARVAETARDSLIALLVHDDEEVQLFGAELLEQAPGMERLPVDAWLAMLAARGAPAREVVVRLFETHVAPARLTLVQVVDLACRAPTSISRLGLRWLEARAPASPADLAAFADLAECACAATGADAGALGLFVVGADDVYDRDRVLRFFDSRNEAVRAAAWAWLDVSTKGAADVELWARACETPYDDSRARLLGALDRRANAGVSADALAPLWCSVLLAVHRGGRERQRSVRQLADAIERDPATAGRLLPVLVAAVRCVRGPDRRAGLAAAVLLMERRPELAPQIAAIFPELRLDPAGATS